MVIFSVFVYFQSFEIAQVLARGVSVEKGGETVKRKYVYIKIKYNKKIYILKCPPYNQVKRKKKDFVNGFDN